MTGDADYCELFRKPERVVRVQLATAAQDFVEASLDLLVAVEECFGLPYPVTDAAEKMRAVADSRQF